MKHVHHLRMLGTAVALLLALAAFCNPTATQAEGLTLQPSSPTVSVGGTIFFIGTGFANEAVTSWITAPDQSVTGGNRGNASNGQVKLSFHVPSNAVSGHWSFTAYGVLTKIPVIATFDVIGGNPASIVRAASVLPTSGVPGTKFAFSATGFDKKEKVSYWITAPDGRVVDAHPEGTRANNDGRIDFYWTLPQNAIPGTWVMTMQSPKKSVGRAIPFQVHQ